MNHQKKNYGYLKRFLWFGLLNVAFVLTLLLITGGKANSLIPFFLLYSCTSPFIGLLFSKKSVKKASNLQVLEDNQTYDEQLEWYRNTTYALAEKAGMKTMPEVAIFESEDPNAFATGRSKKDSLVAVSTGLLSKMTPDAVEAVIAHEISHIMNGDMVTQTLLLSFLNMIISVFILPFTIFRLIMTYVMHIGSIWTLLLIHIIEWIISLVLLFFAGLIFKMYSRQREFQADYWASHLTSPSKMISALQQLDGGAKIASEQKRFEALQFNGRSRLLDIFSTHPSIERRIENIEKNFYRN